MPYASDVPSPFPTAKTRVYEVEYQKVTPDGAMATRRFTARSRSIDGAIRRCRTETDAQAIAAVRRIETYDSGHGPYRCKVRVR